MNEPGSNQQTAPDRARWDAVHQTVIRAIRDDAGANNIIVVEGTSYGQDAGSYDSGLVNTAWSALLQYTNDVINFNGKTYSNIAFSFHVYEQWNGGDARMADYLDRLAAKNIPVIIGEYGTRNNVNTMAATDSLFRTAVPRNIGRIAWHWYGGDTPDNSLTNEPNPSAGWKINSCTNPTNLSILGQKVWNDTHNAPPTPSPTPNPTSNPTPAPGTCGTTNVALNKPAAASSVEAAGYEPPKAVDGNVGTRWSTPNSDPQWLQIDLGAVTSVCRVRLNWEVAYGKAYQIQLSNDASAWTTIYSTSTGDGGIDDISGLSGAGRYLRIYGTQRGTVYGYSLWEAEVYSGSAAPTPAPTPAPTTPATSNLVKNGGFEAGTANWSPSNGTGGVVSPGHSGSYALRETNVWGFWGQAISGWSVGGSYTLTVWGKNSIGTCYIGFKGNTFDQAASNFGASWTQKSVTVTVPAGTTWTQVYVTNGATTGDCQADDISLVKN
jgi:hypothetical protein